jgi:RecJ-like exonuclease
MVRLAKVLCISHKADVDGICSAALVSAALKAKVWLSDYGYLIDDLNQIKEGYDEVVICDMGISEATFNEFKHGLQRIRRLCPVTYIDHHTISDDKKMEIKRIGVKLIHDINESASVLTYMHYKDRLPSDSTLLACYGAVTDYMDDSPNAKRLIENYERKYVLLEAALLSYAIARKSDQGFLLNIVSELSLMRKPHEIKGVVNYAIEQLNKITELMQEIRMNAIVTRSFAFAETKEESTGIVASIAKGVFGKDVGIAAKLKNSEGVYDISLRGSLNCRHHLGLIAEKVALMLKGSGGGHAKASGARIPKEKLKEFLKIVDEELTK